MKIKFDSNQEYQLEAIQAVMDVFEGQPLAQGDFEVQPDAVGGALLSQLGFGNNLDLIDDRVLANTQAIQTRHEIKEVSDDLGEDGLNFSVEMETGTGKTYVYLRTIYELNRTYGFKKFVIVVPSVAIREGVLKNIELTQEHFAAIYGNVPVDYWVYESKQASRLRGYANANELQILIMNIDAFNKDVNVINQERESGKYIEFLQVTKPIVIVDEPQNMESDLAKQALARLKPMCTLRYSATHRNVYNLLYKLDPVRAYDLRLVKRIEVDAILDDPDHNKPFIHVKAITATKTKISAKLQIDVDTPNGPKRKVVTVGQTHSGKWTNQDLHIASDERAGYKGFITTEIDAGNEKITFGNGITLRKGDTHGGHNDEVMRAQVFETVKEHFEKELRIHNTVPEDQRMKVLSLFFIDKVANYAPDDGKIREWFVEAYTEISAKDDYKPLKPPAVEDVHNGYFAQTKKGEAKDSSGKTKADDEAYHLIMRDKERLLDMDEPLRFIFSHSALREGWDNPNVFQICTLNETKSDVKKRQEIGRGLRLPVRVDGTRCFDNNINRLTIIANENYDDFAKRLQVEMEEDCGVEFKDRVSNKRERRTANLVKGWRLNEDFKAIWDRIQHKTRYSVQFSTEELIAKASAAIRDSAEIVKPKLRAIKSELIVTESGVDSELRAAREMDMEDTEVTHVPDILSYLQRETELTRTTLAEILIQSKRLDDIFVNAQQFIDQSLVAIRQALNDMIINGIKYEKIGDEVYEMYLFEDPQHEIQSYVDKLVDVDNSIYDAVVVDSEIERDFATAMSGRDDIKMFFKLPGWFKVETPVGTYNPDWAIVKQEDNKVYLVRETKGSKKKDQLRGAEGDRITCGTAHFEALGVDYKTVVTADEV